jgi:hypothetical protein
VATKKSSTLPSGHPRVRKTSHSIQDTDTSPENKLDEIAGGDVKKTAQLALSPDTPYGDEVGKEGNKPCRDT